MTYRGSLNEVRKHIESILSVYQQEGSNATGKIRGLVKDLFERDKYGNPGTPISMDYAGIDGFEFFWEEDKTLRELSEDDSSGIGKIVATVAKLGDRLGANVPELSIEGGKY